MPRSTKRSTTAADAANADGNTADLAADDALVAIAPPPPLEAPPADEVVKVEDPLAEQQEQEQHLHNVVDQESALEA